MTLSGWVMLGALALFAAGSVFFSRRPPGRSRVVGILGVAIVAIVVGWFGWLLGTQA